MAYGCTRGVHRITATFVCCLLSSNLVGPRDFPRPQLAPPRYRFKANSYVGFSAEIEHTLNP